MCSACCGPSGTVVAKRKGLKRFMFNVKPADLKSVPNKWLDAVKKRGWSVVKQAHSPDAHYYHSNEVWDNHIYLIQKGSQFATFMCKRAPMQGANVLTGEGKRLPLKAPSVKNPKFDPKARHYDDNGKRLKNEPRYKAPNDAQLAKSVGEQVTKAGFKGTDKKTATAHFDKIVAGWTNASLKVVKVAIMAKDAETAQKVLTNKGWKVKAA